MGRNSQRTVVVPLQQPRGGIGSDELNLAEFPLATFARRVNPEQKTLVFEDDIFDEGARQRVHRKLVISASDAFGLPTPADSDVLLVLMWLTQHRNQFASPTVPFTRYELVQRLGWDAGGKSYRRVQESLQRWAGVTLFYNRAWWDRAGRSWRSQTFHVIESLDLRGRRRTGGGDDDVLSSFTWNAVLFESFSAHNIKRLDLDTYFRLKLPAARQAYRFLDKRFFRSRRLEMDLRTFACEHVGLSRNCDAAQIRRKLQPAVEELESIGFLAPRSVNERYRQVRRGAWSICLERAKPDADTDKGCESTAPLVQALIDRGVHAATATELAESASSDRIREKLDYHDWLVKRHDARVARNAAGFLAAAIRNDYQVGDDFRRQNQPRRPSSSSRANSEKRNSDVPDPLSELRSHLASLNDSDRGAVERAALDGATAFERMTLERLTAAGSPLAAEVRVELVRKFLAKSLPQVSRAHGGKCV